MFEINRYSVFTLHIGKARGISCADLLSISTWCAPDETSMRNICHIIEALRREGKHICGHPGIGFCIATNEEELNKTCKYLLDRGMTTLKKTCRIESLPYLFHGQLKLSGS